MNEYIAIELYRVFFSVKAQRKAVPLLIKGPKMKMADGNWSLMFSEPHGPKCRSHNLLWGCLLLLPHLSPEDSCDFRVKLEQVYSFIHSFDKYVFGFFYVSGTVPVFWGF